MPREETIQIKIDKSLTTAPINELKKAADELKKAFGSIKVSDTVKVTQEQAKASREIAKVEKEVAKALNEKAKAAKSASAAIIAHEKAEQEIYKTLQQESKALKDNEKAMSETSKRRKESANALKAEASAQKELENATNAKLRAQKTAQQISTEEARTVKEIANAHKAKANAIKATDQAQNQLNKTMTSGVGIARNMGSAMMSFAKQLIGFYGVTQVLRSALTEMKSMNDELTTYRKVTGATMQQMEAMRSKAYGAAKSYGQSPSDFLASAATMARAGYGDTSAEMAELATKTQLVGDMTADAASQFLIAVDAAYKYKGNLEQLNSVLDSANELDNKYATTIEKISEGITLVASLAATAQVPIEQMMAALGTMTATTQRAGSEAARGFRYILLHAMGDTTTEIEEGVTATEEGVKTLTDAVMKYGDESVKNAVKAGKLINPMEKIVALQKAYKEGALSNEDLYDIGVKVAGVRQYNMFMALVQNPEMYNSMLNDIANSTGSAQREIAAMMDSWSKKLERFKATWTELVNNTVSDQFIKGLLDSGTAALEFAGNLENLATMAGGALVAIKALSAGIANLQTGRAFGGFNIGMGIAGLAISAIGIGISAYQKSIKDMQEKATKAVTEAVEKSSSVKSLESLVKRYSKIASDGIQTEKGELTELKTLQSELNGLVGDQASAIDIVNGKYSDTIIKLSELTKTQREAAQETLRAALSGAVASFQGSDLNGLFNIGSMGGWSGANVSVDAYNQQIIDWLANSKYLSVRSSAFTNDLFFQKPKDAEGIVAFYKEVQDFYTFLGSTSSTGEKATKDIKSMGEEFPHMYSELAKFLGAVKDAADPVKTAQEALDELVNGFKDLGGEGDGSASGAENGIKGVTDSVDALTRSIENATKAKEKFDDAMKESKADAFNSYQEAYQTYQKELKEGRVNSTAFHASARMVLGDDVYYSAGGDSKKIRGLMNKKGGSGSAQQAADILYGTYKDEKGNVIQGGGLWQLLSKTKGFDKSLLTDKNGNWQIPDLEPYMKLITSQWGNLTEEAIRGAWNALDQYDREGKNTSDKLKQQKEEEGKKSEDLGSAKEEESNASKEAAEAAQELADAETNAAQATEAATEAKTEETQAVEEGGETTSALAPKIEEAQSLYEVLVSIENLYSTLGTAKVNAEEAINASETLTSNIDSLEKEGDITVDIKNGASTTTTVSSVNAIISALQLIKLMDAAGVSVDASLKGTLYSQLTYIWDNLDEPSKQKFLLNAELVGGTELVEEIKGITNPSTPYSAEISVGANTKLATTAADAAVAEINKKTATIRISAQVAAGAKFASDYESNPANKSVYNRVIQSGGGSGKPNLLTKQATGTRNHPGGLSLVNDGTGPELILDRGRAFIAGNGGPTLVNLQKGAKVFTASETRSILSGNGVPAYAEGTYSVSNGTEPGGVTGIGKIIAVEEEEIKKKPKKRATPKAKTKKEKVNEDAYKDLTSMIDYIINRVGEALDEQLGIIDAQIEELKAARDAAKQQNELEERQKAVAEAQKDLAEALGERTVRYLGEDGKWHWMADARSVKSAQESLTKAQDSLREYEEDMAFNAQVEALENQKKVLQDEYNEITKTWSKIQDGVNTPTGEISKLIADVLKGGTAQEKKGATTAQDLLLKTMLGGGSYKGNYKEALSAISKATAGNPVMPGEASATLASLIAMSGAGGAGGSVTDALKAGTKTISSGVVGGLVGGASNTNVNYFINGLQLGSDQANQPLSAIMRNLSVYTNTQVN